MKQYIERQAAIAVVAENTSLTVLGATEVLGMLPAADIVPVVRCKDCRYARPYESDSSKRKCVITNCCFGETYFCDYAIRMGGGEHHAD